MGFKTESREIAGLNVTTTQLGASRAMELSVKLGQVLSAALKELDGVSMESGIGALGPALMAGLSQLKPGDITSLRKELLSNTKVVFDGKVVPLGGDNSDAMIDMVFTGNLAALFQTMQFALEVNYGDLLKGALTGSASNKNPGENQ